MSGLVLEKKRLETVCHLDVFTCTPQQHQELMVWKNYFESLERVAKAHNLSYFMQQIRLENGRYLSVLISSADMFIGIIDLNKKTLSSECDFSEIRKLSYKQTTEFYKFVTETKDYVGNAANNIFANVWGRMIGLICKREAERNKNDPKIVSKLTDKQLEVLGIYKKNMNPYAYEEPER